MSKFEDISWMMKYRALTVDDYVFEDDMQRAQISSWIENGKIPGNLLLYGPAGTGKSNLASILINSILSKPGALQHDLYVMKERSVTGVDKLLRERWLNKPCIKSKQKIVLIEEIDKCSPQAQGQLKDDPLEKNQERVSFICSTNKFYKIDPALVSRFNFQYNLKSTNRLGIVRRLTQILEIEKVKYEDEKLEQYVESNPRIGIRDLINNLQCAVFDDILDFSKIRAVKSPQEELVISYSFKILDFLLKADQRTRMFAVIDPAGTKIKDDYNSLLQILEYNQELNYDVIYHELEEKVRFLPVKRIISEYIEEFEYKRDRGLHFIAFIYDAVKSLTDLGY